MTKPILDTSDIDQYLGKPITASRLREPLANNDIRRWVHAMHYATLLPPSAIWRTCDEEGRHLVRVRHKMANQKGAVMRTATAEVHLPKRTS